MQTRFYRYIFEGGISDTFENIKQLAFSNELCHNNVNNDHLRQKKLPKYL